MKRLTILLATALCWLPASAAIETRVDSFLPNAFVYRNLGPFRAGGWVADIAVPDTPARAHLYTFYVAARHGGVWKTVNNGMTFEPVFDSQNVFSIGAIAVAPSNQDIVWVGTGEPSNARSSYSGAGIYRSTDGAKTWQFIGLKDTQHISKIVIHPANPDIVYVAAMGHLFSTNEERGVFKTTDGGKTWTRVLYVDDKTGAIDLVIKRNDPNTLYAAMYECIRYPWQLHDGGPGTGIHKTTDGGATWKKLGGGLPGGDIGRIGIDLYQKDPRILYAILDNRNPQPRMMGGEVYRTDDEGLTWRKMSADTDDLSRKSGYAFNQLRVDTGNPDRIFITGSSIVSSSDGGKTWAGLQQGPQPRPFRRAFGDFRTLWIDPQDPERMIAGSDGGVFISNDGGKTSDHLLGLPLGEVYALTVDMENPYNIYAGLQDHESWKGPVNGWSGSVGIEDWVTVGIGDGMYNQVDSTDSRWVYNTQEFGKHARLDQVTRVRTNIAPTRANGQTPLRFNWVAPIRLSPHDAKTLYAGAQVLFRSTDRGDHWQEISPDLTTNDASKISAPGGSIQFCTITTISESPVTAGVIWVGSDDGKVQVTQNAGATWTDATSAIAKAGGPEDAWVTRVLASSSKAGTAYVSKSKHRQDDFRAFLFKTTDFGATWSAIANNLPAKPINVVFEDQKNSDLLFVGNDVGVFVSLDGGKQWTSLRGNMPVVPVHDLLVHPRENDLVAGTYGRGIWVTDITPLREINEEVLGEDAHFFKIEAKARRQEGALGNYRLYGDRYVVTPNEPNGIVLNYNLKEQSKETITITIADARGATTRTLPGTSTPGMNRVVWDLNDSNRRPSPAGDYVVTLQIGEKKYAQSARVLE